MQLYDIGYLDIKEFDLLVKTIIALEAVLVDVRFSPQSRAPQWRQKYLQEHLPDGTYVHMQSLGNEAYKTPGAFSFPDLDGGMKAITEVLKTKNVIMMCGCWNRQECHRLKIVREYESAYGVTSTPLNKKFCQQITATIDLPGDPQLKLF